ncbi:uncharacterized protein LOC129586298 [Paramacrobiotus metropolitanus]|uniref:uncharacterized protein LOC129586298 n=1 Tax=Paramacrobiotus metropolitanus TaxID=2943436 RepID=UPI0024464678|nr:uncharacterized protein LOC129586298 [Paramacrobiotus metropolitanus]
MEAAADLLLSDQTQSSFIELLNSTTQATKDGDEESVYRPLEPWHIVLIALGVSVVITAVVVLLVLWKWRRKGHRKDSLANGAFLYDREPLFNHKPNHPEIVITEPTNIDSISYSPSGHGTNSEVYSSKSVTHVPPCVLAEIEDLDASELVSPATTENNLRISPGLVSIQMTPANSHSAKPASQQVQLHVVPSAVVSSSEEPETTEEAAVVEDDAAARSGRSQSVGSASSYNERLYTRHSPHGMLPYGIADYTATVFVDNITPDSSISTHLPECDQLLTDR